MKLAVNYSPQAATLYRQGHIRLDLFKCPDWPDLISEAAAVAPYYVHFPLIAGDNSLPQTDWAEVARFLEGNETRFVNVHLTTAQGDLADMPVNSRESVHVEQVTERLLEDVKTLTAHFGATRVIAENVIYRGHRATVLRPTVLPEVIGRVVEESGCGFLLDLSHARISTHYLAVEEPGVSLWDYLEALPVAHLRELHVTGIHYRGDKLSDHLGLTTDDWEVTGEVFRRIHAGRWATPDTVAFEYGGIGKTFAWRSESRVLAEQMPRLDSLVRGIAGIAPERVTKGDSNT